MKRYAEIHDRMVEGVRAYAEEVRARRFPDAEHVYSVDPAEVEELKRYLDTGEPRHRALGLVGAERLAEPKAPAQRRNPG